MLASARIQTWLPPEPEKRSRRVGVRACVLSGVKSFSARSSQVFSSLQPSAAWPASKSSYRNVSNLTTVSSESLPLLFSLLEDMVSCPLFPVLLRAAPVPCNHSHCLPGSHGPPTKRVGGGQWNNSWHPYGLNFPECNAATGAFPSARRKKMEPPNKKGRRGKSGSWTPFTRYHKTAFLNTVHSFSCTKTSNSDLLSGLFPLRSSSLHAVLKILSI